MIKALIANKEDPILIAGLEKENVSRLKADYPIDVSFKSFGLDMPGRLVILYGRTGREIEAILRRAGAETRHKGFAVDPRRHFRR